MHDLNDSTSAEAYCTLGGEVVPAKTAQQIGERSDLQPWAALVTPLAAPGKQGQSQSQARGASQLKKTKTVDEEVKKDLVMILLEVYMSGGYVPPDLFVTSYSFLTLMGTTVAGRRRRTAQQNCSTHRQ